MSSGMDAGAPRHLDEHLAKALAHPLRQQVLHLLADADDGVASPRELADALTEPLGKVSYHVRVLRDLGVLELVRTRHRRGALEHFYRATDRSGLDDVQWGRLPATFRRSTLGRDLVEILEAAATSSHQGGLGDPSTHVTHLQLSLDDEGWAEINALLDQTREAALRIQAASVTRAAATPPAIAARLALLHFRETP